MSTEFAEFALQSDSMSPVFARPKAGKVGVKGFLGLKKMKSGKV